MTTPSGTISLNDVNVELGFAGTTLISMNQSSVRTLAGVPSGAISMQNLQGKSNRVTASATISANTANYVLNTAKASGYVAGKTDMTLTINSGVYVYSASTGSYALTVDSSWASGDTVTIVNNGTIMGRGGDGGRGAENNIPFASPGSTGGPALYVQRATSINNVNRISGGGGGGGGGAWSFFLAGKTPEAAGGGGGGGGIGGSSGGVGGVGYPSSDRIGGTGGSGTLTSNGAGGAAGQAGKSGAGGSGGTYGASGSGGGDDTTGTYGTPGSGASGGAAVNGNSNITWIATGTRNGSIS